MEDVDLREIFDLVKSKILFIIIFTVTIVLCGILYMNFFKVPEYKSSSTIVLSSNNTDTSTITSSDVLLNKNLVSTYSQIAKSRTVLETVINFYKLNMTYEQLSKKITVTQVSDTEIIQISVVDPDAKLASNITNKIAEVFTSEVSNIYNMKNIKILDVAIKASKPYNIDYVKQFFISLAAGLLLSLAIVFMFYFFDNTIKTIEQVEAKLELPILGRIPLQKGKK